MGLHQKQVGRAQRERTSRKAAGAGGADYPSSTISQQTALPTESVRHIEIQTDEHLLLGMENTAQNSFFS